MQVDNINQTKGKKSPQFRYLARTGHIKFFTYSGFGKWAFKSNLEQISSQSGKHRSLMRDTWPIRFGHVSVIKSRSGNVTSLEMKWSCDNTANDTTSSCKLKREETVQKLLYLLPDKFSVLSTERTRWHWLTVVGSSPKKKGLSSRISDSTFRSFLPNSSISSGLWTPIPWALTFLQPWNHWTMRQPSTNNVTGVYKYFWFGIKIKIS